jgi:putative heme degradation protein
MPIAADTRPVDASQMLAGWEHARARGLNNRAAAAELGVSEAELIACGCGRFVTRLLPEGLALLRDLPLLGEVKAIVRNPSAVIERAGTVHDFKPNGIERSGVEPSGVERSGVEPNSVEPNGIGAILVEADHFEMVCELAEWRKAFALREQTPRGVKLSLQFFTAEGVSTAKFFLRPGGNIAAFATLVQAYSDPDQSTSETSAPPRNTAYLPLERLVAVHHPGLLGFLQLASRTHHSLHLVVRSGAASLTTTKTIERVKRSDKGGWVNVLDDSLDLHLHEDKLRYLRLSRDADRDSGWFHWFSDRRAIALSVRVDEGWRELARSAGVPSD